METERATLHEKIRRLAREKQAIILAHNYQRYEVQQVADLVGDSLGLSAKAAATDARMIVFCGVHFMAESAKILSPGKKVVMPRADAGCPLANTSAAIKAEVDICCTSANMQQVVESLPDHTVLFVPDGNMGRYLQTRLPER